MSYLATLHTGHEFTFDEGQTIRQPQDKAGRLSIKAIPLASNRIHRRITLHHHFTFIKSRLDLETIAMFYERA